MVFAAAFATSGPDARPRPSERTSPRPERRARPHSQPAGCVRPFPDPGVRGRYCAFAGGGGRKL